MSARKRAPSTSRTCLTSTPFGIPVVPDVYRIAAICSSSASGLLASSNATSSAPSRQRRTLRGEDARQDVGERIAAVRRNRDDDDGLRVRQHLLELALAQAGAERNGDRAEAPDGEQAGHELRRVRGDEGDPLAPEIAGRSELLLQPRRELAQRGVGQNAVPGGERGTVGGRLLEEARDHG